MLINKNNIRQFVAVLIIIIPFFSIVANAQDCPPAGTYLACKYIDQNGYLEMYSLNVNGYVDKIEIAGEVKTQWGSDGFGFRIEADGQEIISRRGTGAFTLSESVLVNKQVGVLKVYGYTEGYAPKNDKGVPHGGWVTSTHVLTKLAVSTTSTPPPTPTAQCPPAGTYLACRYIDQNGYIEMYSQNVGKTVDKIEIAGEVKTQWGSDGFGFRIEADGVEIKSFRNTGPFTLAQTVLVNKYVNVLKVYGYTEGYAPKNDKGVPHGGWVTSTHVLTKLQPYYITVDPPPTISISSPYNGQSFTTNTITVSGTASDNVGISKVEVKVGTGSWQLASGTTSWSKQVTLSSGSNTIYAKATDTSGKTAESSVTVTYTSPPTPTIKTHLIFISSEPSGAEVYLDDNYEGITPLTLSVSDGNHAIKITKRELGYVDWFDIIQVSGDRTINAVLKLPEIPTSPPTPSIPLPITRETVTIEEIIKYKCRDPSDPSNILLYDYLTKTSRLVSLSEKLEHGSFAYVYTTSSNKGFVCVFNSKKGDYDVSEAVKVRLGTVDQKGNVIRDAEIYMRLPDDPTEVTLIALQDAGEKFAEHVIKPGPIIQAILLVKDLNELRTKIPKIQKFFDAEYSFLGRTDEEGYIDVWFIPDKSMEFFASATKTDSNLHNALHKFKWTGKGTIKVSSPTTEKITLKLDITIISGAREITDYLLKNVFKESDGIIVYDSLGALSVLPIYSYSNIVYIIDKENVMALRNIDGTFKPFMPTFSETREGIIDKDGIVYRNESNGVVSYFDTVERRYFLIAGFGDDGLANALKAFMNGEMNVVVGPPSQIEQKKSVVDKIKDFIDRLFRRNR